MAADEGCGDRSARSIPTFVGREPETGVVVERIRAAAAGTGQVVIVEGEAGIGKTRLVAECVSRADVRNLTVLTGVGDELASDRPFGPLLQALGPGVLDDTASVVPGADDSRPLAPDRSWRAVDGLVDALEGAARDHPIVLVLEDVHWADEGTLRVVGVLARRLALMPLAVVLTRRPLPTTIALDSLVRRLDGAGAVSIRLGALDEPYLGQIASDVVGDDLTHRLKGELSRAGGNPFFLIELVTALANEPEADPLSWTPSLQHAILARLGQVDEHARVLLGIAAVLGTRFRVEELAAASGESLARLLPAIESALTSGVLTEVGSSLAFRHDLVREAIDASMAQPVRVGLHRQVGRAFAASGRPAVEVAHHLAEGATAGDPEAVAWLERAAAEVAERAPGTAADLLARAVELAGGRQEVLRLRAEQARVLAWAGRLVEAEDLARSIVEQLGDAELAASVRAALGAALFFRGRVGEAADILDGAAALEVPEQPLHFAEAALAHLTGGRIEAAVDRAARAAQLARSHGHVGALALALCVRAALDIVEGQGTSAASAREALLHVARAPERAHRYGAHVLAGFAFCEADCLEEAATAVERGMRLDGELGSGWSVPTSHWALGWVHLLRGEWDTAIAQIEAGLELAHDMDFRVLAPFAHALLAEMHLHRDELTLAETAVVAAETIGADDGPQLGFERALWCRAKLSAARGDGPAALAALDLAWKTAQGFGARTAYRLFGPDTVRISLELGARDMAEGAVADLESSVAPMGLPGYEGVARQCRGLLDDDPEPLVAAVELLRRCPRVMELAAACGDAAGVLARRERLDDARALADEAVSIYDRVGAARDAARLRGALRGLGVRRARRESDGDGGAPAFGLAPLSPTERRVAELVAEGLTNKEIAGRLFVSRRTVDNHLYRMFTKLGVASRVELALRVAHQ